MLGFALALVAVGAVTGFAYLTRRFPLASGEGGGPSDPVQRPTMEDPTGAKPNGAPSMKPGGSHAETPADQLVRAPNDAAITNPQAGSTDTAEAIDAQQRANVELPADYGANPDLDSPWVPPDQDTISESSLNGIASPLDMICGGGEDSPEYKDGWDPSEIE